MDLSIYDIIQGPAVSEKAQKQNMKLKKLVLKVHPKSNKPLIKEALEKLFDVKVDSVRTIVRKGRIRKMGGRMIIKGKLRKYAIVTLKEGYKMDLFGHAGSEAQVVSEVKEEKES